MFKENAKRWAGWAIVAVAVLVAGVLGVRYPMPETPGIVALGTTHFTNVEAEDLTATDDLVVTDDATIGGDMAVTGTTSWGCSTSTINNNLALTGTLEVTGAVDFNSTLTVDGATELDGDITLENDETISNDVNGTVTATVGSTGYFAVATGNLRVGDGAPNDTINGEDAYIEGTLEVDGNTNLDGTLNVAGASELNGDITLQNDETLSNNHDGTITATVGATGYFAVATGNLVVGDGTPDDTINGEDAYIEGTLEVDGNANLDGTLDVAGTTTLAGVADVGTWFSLSAATVISVTADSTITPTGTYQPLTSAAAVTCNTTTCIVDGTRTGDLLLLENQNASDEITIDGTGGNVECKANVALGAGDTLLLIWNGTDWYCVSGYDNS